MEVKSVEELVSSLLEDNKQFVTFKCKHLLSHGENYGSVMLDIKVTLKDNDGNEEVVDCVGKTCPPRGIWWTIFNIPVTFKKEIGFYQTLVPTLNNFGKEKGIEKVMPLFAKCYGSRISLDQHSDEVDTDAVLLLENVKSRGFRLGDRFVGFNIQETKLILRDVAMFHAVPIAHKIQKPGEFKEKIRPYLNDDLKFIPPPDMVKRMTSLICETVSSDPKLIEMFPRIKQNFQRYCEEIIVNPPKIREPFATMVHNDLWVNNTMLKYDNDIPLENIIVDFQGLDYNSPTRDLLFFLYTSVELSLLESSFDDLVKYYFQIFTETLTKLDCDTEQFGFEKFVEEMGALANESQLFHIVLMLKPIFMKKEDAKDLSTMAESLGLIPEESFHQNFRKRALFILSDFERRGWI